MKLKSLLSNVKPVQTGGSLNKTVTGVTPDVTHVKPGMVYVDLPERNPRKNDPVLTAIDQGAVAVIYEGKRALSRKATGVKVADAREALAQAAAAFYNYPSRHLKVIGIAGGGECTAIAFLVRHILEQGGIQTGLLTSIRQEISGKAARVFFPNRRTAETEVHGLMAKMVKAGCAACVFETDMEALARKRSIGVDFDLAIFSNFAEAGVPGRSRPGLSRLSREFRGFLSKTGTAVINIDHAREDQHEAARQYELVLTYGFAEEATIRARLIAMSTLGTEMVVQTPEAEFHCAMPLAGRENVYSALAAIGACLKMNVTIENIQRALTTMPMVPGRLERVDLKMPFDLFIDDARTEPQLERTLRILREITTGRLILAVGCRGGQPAITRARIGGLAARLTDFTIITTNNPRNEPPLKIASEIVQGFVAQGEGNFKVELDRQAAIQELVEMGQPGDALLIAGKGHELFQEIEDTIVPFDDRIHAREMAEWIRSVQFN